MAGREKKQAIATFAHAAKKKQAREKKSNI
jgi:hypothetical protein